MNTSFPAKCFQKQSWKLFTVGMYILAADATGLQRKKLCFLRSTFGLCWSSGWFWLDRLLKIYGMTCLCGRCSWEWSLWEWGLQKKYLDEVGFVWDNGHLLLIPTNDKLQEWCFVKEHFYIADNFSTIWFWFVRMRTCSWSRQPWALSSR